MNLRRDLEKRIDRKRDEQQYVEAQISELLAKKAAFEAVIAELQSVLKTLPKDENESGGNPPDKELRRGSDAFKAREELRNAGHPLYVDDILAQIGKEVTKEARRSLSGQLAQYVREGQIFSRPEPNTFGLLEWSDQNGNSEKPTTQFAAKKEKTDFDDFDKFSEDFNEVEEKEDLF